MDRLALMSILYFLVLREVIGTKRGSAFTCITLSSVPRQVRFPDLVTMTVQPGKK